MNIIQQAAEAKYPYLKNKNLLTTKRQREKFEEEITYFLQFLSQQGDEEIVENIMQERYNSPFKCHPYGQGESAYFHQEGVGDMLQQALAIGRATREELIVNKELKSINQRFDELREFFKGHNLKEDLRHDNHRWIPVSERLPEEKDATEINGVKVVKTLVWHKDFECWQEDVVNWNDQWLKNKNPHYWRTPSQYPEPPKQRDL